MANFVLLVAVLLGGSSLIALYAGDLEAGGLTWAGDVCSLTPFVCERPQQVAFVAAGLGGIWILMKLVSGLRG
jgi:hypothetical protein